MDLVGTCAKTFLEEWLSEGGLAGTTPDGTIYCWKTRHRLALHISSGERFYVVAHGKLRGWAYVAGVTGDYHGPWAYIYREGGGTAVTIPRPIPGFQGLRKRWWDRSEEIPFPDWKTP